MVETIAPIAGIALKIVPVVLAIAKLLIDRLKKDGITPAEAAAIALFNALTAYIEESTE